LDERRLLLRVSEAAALCGYSRSFLYERINAGDIPVIRLERTVRIPRAWLEKWIAQKVDAWERIQ
jgi:DNA binding domain, excisionase family